MWTIFLDIDGTLLRTGGAGLDAIRETVAELFGDDIELPQVSVCGRTDAGILSDLFRDQTFDWQSRLPEFYSCYSTKLKVKLATSGGEVYPGVVEFLQRLWHWKELAEQNGKGANSSEADGVAIGLLTGNCRLAAIAKIEHFGLDSYVEPFGGFGDEDPSRDDVASSAKASAADFLGDRFDAEKIWVVGDTPNDIRCGRSIGARVLAVATGGPSMEELAKYGPDLCVENLEDSGLVEQLFFQR